MTDDHRFYREDISGWQDPAPRTAPEGIPQPRYPAVRVRLTGTDGNAVAILGRVLSALREAHVPETACEALSREATAGDYEHLLRTVQRWVTVR